MKQSKLLIILYLLISFVLPANADNKDEERRAVIQQFIQNYKTAYQKEKISYIKDFFSNDALMITETGLRRVGKEMMPNTSKSRPYHSIIENKKEYLSKLNDYFNKNGHISIGISNLFINQHSKYPDIYGVNFFQIWDDTGQANIIENKMPGYIFLLIDFRNSEIEPIIHVRTWQPKSNISKPSDKYTLDDFTIISTK